MPEIQCRCDGRYDGCTHGVTCYDDGGGHRSPYFCVECDKRRIKSLSLDFERLRASFSDPDA